MQIDPNKLALLNLNLRLVTTPAIRVVKAGGTEHAMPEIEASTSNGFAFEVEALLPYDSLSQALRTLLHGKRLEITEGLINQYVIIEGCKLVSNESNLVAEVPFSGSYNGTIYLTGRPVYNAASHRIELQNVAYDLTTKSLFLKGIKWLFGKLILEEIKKYTSVDVTQFYSIVTARINDLLNKEWTKGVQASGTMDNLVITGIEAHPQQLVIRSYCSGSLKLNISEQLLQF